MSEWMFQWSLLGKSIEEIIEKCRNPKPTVKEVRETIEREREKFEETCLKRVVAKAKDGDVSAIDWLAKRGLFEFPESFNRERK